MSKDWRVSAKGRSSRSRGLTFERSMVDALRPVFPSVKRHLEFQKSEANGYDLDNTDHFRIQCKRMARYAPLTKIQEVICDEELGEVPVLITAGDGLPPLVCLPLEEFVRLVAVSKRVID